MKLAIELEEPYAEELELPAFSSGKTVKEYVEASVKADVEAGMSFLNAKSPRFQFFKLSRNGKRRLIVFRHRPAL
jgi:hypothetical protein